MNIKRKKLKFTKGTIDWRKWYQRATKVFLCAQHSRIERIDKMLMQSYHHEENIYMESAELMIQFLPVT